MKISNCKDLILESKSENEINLTINKNDLLEFQKLFKSIRKKLLSQNVSFSAFIRLHNEKIVINQEKIDNRSYGLLRILLKDNNEVAYSDDINLRINNFEKAKKRNAFLYR